jgi:molecular chaperone IbpA
MGQARYSFLLFKEKTMTRELSLRSTDIPNIHKFGIGFDSMFDELLRAASAQTQGNYPPYNVIKTGEETVLIEVAVAGFNEGEISITVENSVLNISGEHVHTEGANWEYFHRGLSRRNFKQKFTLAEHVEVINAEILNGILNISLERKIPEEKKPKNIAIKYNK